MLKGFLLGLNFFLAINGLALKSPNYIVALNAFAVGWLLNDCVTTWIFTNKTAPR